MFTCWYIAGTAVSDILDINVVVKCLSDGQYKVSNATLDLPDWRVLTDTSDFNEIAKVVLPHSKAI